MKMWKIELHELQKACWISEDRLVLPCLSQTGQGLSRIVERHWFRKTSAVTWKLKESDIFSLRRIIRKPTERLSGIIDPARSRWICWCGNRQRNWNEKLLGSSNTTTAGAIMKHLAMWHPMMFILGSEIQSILEEGNCRGNRLPGGRLLMLNLPYQFRH